MSNFLEEISSLYSVVFLDLFVLIAEEGFLISSCYSLELCIQMGISFVISVTIHGYNCFFSGVEIFKSLYFEICSSVLLTIVTMMHITPP